MTTEPNTDGNLGRRYAVVALLAIGLIGGLVGCVVAYGILEEHAVEVQKFRDLPPMTEFFYAVRTVVFVVPMIVWLAGMALTRVGKQQVGAGISVGFLLLAFSVLWPFYARLALQFVFEPVGKTAV